MVKFDKRKHKKARWITSSLLKSINTKDKLYMKLIKTNIDKDPKIVILKINLFISRIWYVAASMAQSGYVNCEHSHCIKMV